VGRGEVAVPDSSPHDKERQTASPSGAGCAGFLDQIWEDCGIEIDPGGLLVGNQYCFFELAVASNGSLINPMLRCELFGR